MPGDTSAAKEWNEEIDYRKMVAAFAAVDAQLTGPVRKPRKDRAQHLGKHEGGTLWEFKAPPRGDRIYRVLAFCPNGWDMFVVLAAEKKSQQLPSRWIETAKLRVTAAKDRGSLK